MSVPNATLSNDPVIPRAGTPRLAFVDLLFCWPPNGGADVDAYHVMHGLAALGFEICLFVPVFEGIPGRGRVQMETLSFRVCPVPLPSSPRGPESVASALKAAVDVWFPDVVFLMHGYALKPYVAEALSNYPLVGRYYAHELLCARDARRFKDGAHCPYDVLRTPGHCQRCAFEYLGSEIKSGQWTAWTQDYLCARAWTRDHTDVLRHSLAALDRIIVSNSALARELEPYHEHVVVIPGGIQGNCDSIPHKYNSRVEDIYVIVMTGRVEDPAKGLDTLVNAAGHLARRRQDFRILVTHFDACFQAPYLSSTGWLTHEETLALYATAHICVVPSRWHEPFGLVAVEAMAAGLPVCATDCGGLRDIVVHDHTGFLFPSGDVPALSAYLDRLLSDGDLRHCMGAAGRQRALEHYTWERILHNDYLPLLESLLP